MGEEEDEEEEDEDDDDDDDEEKEEEEEEEEERPEPRSCVKREVERGSLGASCSVVCFSLFSTVVSVDTIFVIVFLTTVKRTSYKLHKLISNGWLPTTLMANVLVLVVLLALASRRAWN